jgi:pyrroloquinoline quinone biosynthesis protein B
MTDELRSRLYGSKLVLFDGTLWVNDEMASSKVGEKTGQRMGHMNNSGPDGTMAAFEDIDVERKVFIHINTTNPILLGDSPERKEVESNGWEVSFDGMEIEV